VWRWITRSRFLDALATVIALAEVFLFGGRPFVLAFAAALFGLKWTLPLDEKRNGNGK